MYFLFLISVFCSVQNASDISELNKLKSLLKENDSRKSVKMVIHEFLNINILIDFDTVLETSDINEFNEILKPLLAKDDSIKSVDDGLYKLYTNRNLIIPLHNDKKNHLEIKFICKEGGVLPECLGRLIHIKVLILTNNDLSELPEFFIKFTSLYRLDLSSNKFKTIPKVIFSFRRLIDLNLSENEIKSVDDGIENLVELQFLDLSDNCIESISGKFKNLIKLIYLNLGCNVNIIRTSENDMDIAKDIKLLRAMPSSVKCLYLRQTGLRYIPCDVVFRNLYILDVSKNYLENLSLWYIQCFNILVVDASSNSLTSIPECSDDEFKELRKLNLRGNKTMALVYLRKYMFSALGKLDLRDCHIKKFEVEGYNIMDSTNGKYLHYENPDINDSRPSNIASDKDESRPSIIYSLKTLSITITNKFVVPNLLVFPNLLNLDITNKDYSYNIPSATKSWFDGLSKMKELRTLKVDGFILVDIPTVIFGLKNLESLTLNTCGLDKISNEITKLSNLKNIDLYNNHIDNINPKIFEFKEPINIILDYNPFSHLPSVINNDKLKFKLTIDVRKVDFFKKDENNLGLMDIDYKNTHKINVFDTLHRLSISIKELYGEAYKGEEHQWELERIVEIKQRTVKESQNNYNVIIDYWNILEKHITNNGMKEKFLNYIKVFYGIKKRKEEGETTEIIQNNIKNYLEAVLETLKNLVSTKNTDIVEKTLNKIDPGLSMNMEDQLEHFSYAYCFLVDNFKESNFIEHFIKNKIASLKYHALKEITINDIDDIDVFLYWQNKLSDTLGLPMMSEQYYLSTNNSFLKCKEYIIYQFFKLITVKNVVKDLYESINKNQERIMMTYKYISDNNDMEILQDYIEYEGDIKQKNITKITEQGIYFILKKMNLTSEVVKNKRRNKNI